LTNQKFASALHPTDPTPPPIGYNFSVALASAERTACELANVQNNPLIGFIRVLSSSVGVVYTKLCFL